MDNNNGLLGIILTNPIKGGRKMKKRVFLLAMALSLVFVFAAGTFSDAQTVKPIELKLSHFMSPMHNLHADVFAPFSKTVEEKTKGRVKITVYPGEALGKARDHYDMAVNGVTDIAFFIHGYTTGRFPLTSVIELPFLIPSAKVGSRVIWELYEKKYLTEYPGVKVLSLWVHSPGHVHMAKKPAKTLEDLKGVRLRSPGPLQTSLLREFGVSPLTIPIPELYQALQSGMADGAVIPFSAMYDFKLSDIVKHHTIGNLYVMSMSLVMNQKAWEGLSPDIQKIIEENSGSHMSEMAGASYDTYDLKGIEAGKKAGAAFYTLSAEEKKRWVDRSKSVTEKWIADTEAKKLSGKKIYEETQQLLIKYSK
jgi:TRAP-type C4-dicarboxylate transport system substrate-binding protein